LDCLRSNISVDLKKNKALRYFKHFAIALVWLAMSCDSDNPTRTNDLRYFPLQKGLYHIYDVSETNYVLGAAESAEYQLKTVVTDSFLNADENYTYVIHRSKRQTDADEWESLDTWTASRSSREVIVSEGNTPYVVLTFPLSKNATWNGNKYNTVINPTTKQNEDFYAVEQYRVSHTTETDETYTDCVVINQEDNQEFVVFLDQRKEIYAAGIGLIVKETTGLQYCIDEGSDCIGKQIVEDGIIYKQVLREYGHE
jgi:hypothetical protein